MDTETVFYDEHPRIPDFKKGDRVRYKNLRATVVCVFFEKREKERDDRWVIAHFEAHDIGNAQFHPHELQKLDLITRIGELAGDLA